MTYPIIISFYTKSWTYEQHAKRLREECDRLGLRHHIAELPDTGGWISNTRLKPEFIRKSLNELKEPVLWVDVDGSICRHPTFLSLPTSLDFMGRHQRTGPKRTWHVGTMFFNYTDKITKLLDHWCERSKNGTDEASFDVVWKELAETLGLSSVELPAEYFEILTSDNARPTSHTVICHRLSKCERKLAMKRRHAK